MSAGKITSSTIAAEGAIHELVGIDTKQMHNEHVEFGYASGIGGMEAAILGQAQKFPALAEKIETRDIADANRWEA